MIVLTAGDHRFRDMIRVSQRQAESFGYEFLAYDLGGLGMGRAFEFDVAQLNFGEQSSDAFNSDGLKIDRSGKSLWRSITGFVSGCFSRRSKSSENLGERPSQTRFSRDGVYLELEAGRFTRALHKPSIIQNCLAEPNDFVTYLDGDAILLSRIDEVASGAYDIGLVLRPDGDVSWSPHTSGQINAGVMFFANNDAARHFVHEWAAETVRARNDQVAVNQMLGLGNAGWKQVTRRWSWRKKRTQWRFDSGALPRELQAYGARVRLYEPAYNCYTAPLPADAKIVHFKGPANKARFDEFSFLCRRLNLHAA